MLKELNFNPAIFVGGGTRKYLLQKIFKDWRTKCSPSMYEGGVKLDSYCLTRDRS